MECISYFCDSLKNQQIMFEKSAFNFIICDYDFFHITKNKSLDEKSKKKITQKIKFTNIIIINEIEDHDDKIIVIAFEKTIIFLEQSLFSFINNLLSSNTELPVCFLSNTNDIKKKIIFTNKEIKFDKVFENEIKLFVDGFNLSKATKKIENVWSLISPFISAYLIKKSYLQHKKFRIEKFINNINDTKPETIKEGEYIELRNIGNGSVFSCFLIYYIKSGELFVIKRPICFDNELPKLNEREISNYKKISHPFLPKFVGTTIPQNNIVIEFINGQTLENIKQIKLTYNDRINLIFEMMLVIYYLHSNGLIYRDLKPDNIMIDENKTLVLIDFDRLIANDDDIMQTLDLGGKFVAPEISNNNSFTFESDIYSLGKMIKYIVTQTESTNSEDYSKIDEIILKCINENPKNRPSISELIQEFNLIFQSKIQIELLLAKYDEHFGSFKFINETLKLQNLNDNCSQFNYNLGLIYEKGIYVKQDIQKALQYFTLAADQNDPKAQYKISNIYVEGKFVKRDSKKALCYLELSSNQKYRDALYDLSFIYLSGQYVKQDINKSIYYLTQAANQNDPKAQYDLGFMLISGQYVKQDIKKAIYYLTQAADQNEPKAQYNLGTIYLSGQYVNQDIKKAMHYLSLAAKQNVLEAQYNLGFIYSSGQFVQKNIEKAIYYFTLAAEQNDSEAQYNLGVIYYEGKDVTKDIQKAIHYFSLAASSNYLKAHFNLGAIYEKGEFVKKDIKKAIYHYTQAASQDDIDAQYNLGLIYETGEYVKQDIKKAIYYYSKAANQNHLEAQYNLGVIYHEGKYVTRDINKAIHYYFQAAKQNYNNALYNLGIIFYEGIHVTRDIEKAIHFFELAANQNDKKSQYNLGFIYSKGQYVKRDINKSIHFYSLASNQSHPKAQYDLGVIFHEGKYVKQDIQKAVHYFTLAANNNIPEAQFNLGAIYMSEKYELLNINKALYYLSLAAENKIPQASFNIGVIYEMGKYIKKDIKKAIHYFTIAADHNIREAQYNLAIIYEKGEFIEQDIEKSIHYLSLAANQHDPNASNHLGIIYLNGKYIKQNINKSIYYFSQAANQNHQRAQFNLGLVYYFGLNSPQDIQKGIQYIMLASINGDRMANFAHGFLLHEGKNVKRDIIEAIKFYKEASSFNNQYAKNNLGIIYKNGYGEKIKGKAGNAIVYFVEAIRQKHDYLSMYNLAHIYIYDETIQHDINKSIELLIQSSHQFNHSIILLCIILIKQFGFDFIKIEFEIKKRTKNANDLYFKISQIIISLKLNDKLILDNFYKSYRNKDFLYNIEMNPILSSELNNMDDDNVISNIKNLSPEFYDGFGHDLF